MVSALAGERLPQVDVREIWAVLRNNDDSRIRDEIAEPGDRMRQGSLVRGWGLGEGSALS